jgi:hypothetical protein
VTTPIPPLPSHGTDGWDATWGAAVDAAVRELQMIIATLAPATPAVISVNGVTADPAGNVPLGPADVGALPDNYKPAWPDLPPGVMGFVAKDANGNWPSGYDENSNAVYAGGAPDSGERPDGRSDHKFDWEGAGSDPGSAPSGTTGMRQGVDRRSYPNA